MTFLSPARRGRRILVAPGFCPAFGVRCHVFLWAQKLKNYWSNLFEILTWGCASDFYIIGTHSNNVLIWFTKRILGTVFLCPYNVCPKSLTSSQIRQNAYVQFSVIP